MASKKAKGQSEVRVRLTILNPQHFPSLAAIREFVAGDDFSGLSGAISVALQPAREDEDLIPKRWLDDARYGAFRLLDDLTVLARAAVAAESVRAVAHHEDKEETLEHNRRALATLTLSGTPTDWFRSVIRQYLADEAPGAAHAD